MRLAVVLLETKVQRAVTMKSIAQVIGYFIRLASSTLKPAVCFVLSEDTLNVIFFRFANDISLINAIWLKSACYTDNMCGILYLIAILTHRNFECLLTLDGKFSAHHKGCQFFVTTSFDDRITRLEDTIKRKDEEIIKILKKHNALP